LKSYGSHGPVSGSTTLPITDISELLMNKQKINNKALMMAAEADDELSSTFEELILLTCLYSWDARIPRKVTRDIFNNVP
jgi:hypothetical protein